MALSPLKDIPQKDNGTPLDGGISTRSAANYIEALIDDEGRDPNHPEFEQDDNDNSQQQAEDDNNSQDQDEVIDDDTAEAEGDDETPDTDSNSDDDKEAGSDQSDADEPINSLSELAEALEMPIDELKGALKHTFKAAGKEHTVTLAELEKGYQLQADYDRSKGKLAEQQRAFETERQKNLEHYQQQSVDLANTLNLAEQAIMTEYNSQAMQQLRISDPAEWAARMREGEFRLNEIQRARQDAAAKYTQTMHDEQQRYLAEEGKKLADSVEGWGDDMLNSAVDTIKTLGFDDSEILNIADSRLMKAALELRDLRERVKTYEEKMSKANKTVTKIKKKVPKTITAGKARSGNNAAGLQRANIGKLKKQLRSSNSVRDAANVIEALME